MGRDEKANREAREKARELRDSSLQAFTQSFAVLSGCLAVSMVVTEVTGYEDGEGPDGDKTIWGRA